MDPPGLGWKHGHGTAQPAGIWSDHRWLLSWSSHLDAIGQPQRRRSQEEGEGSNPRRAAGPFFIPMPLADLGHRQEEQPDPEEDSTPDLHDTLDHRTPSSGPTGCLHLWHLHSTLQPGSNSGIFCVGSSSSLCQEIPSLSREPRGVGDYPQIGEGMGRSGPSANPHEYTNGSDSNSCIRAPFVDG